jgi:hypothetical protein
MPRKPKAAMEYAQTRHWKAADSGQVAMFGDDAGVHKNWREWQGMPEYIHEDLMPAYQVMVHLETAEQRQRFAKEIVEQDVSPLTRSIWFPKQEAQLVTDKRWRSEL